MCPLYLGRSIFSAFFLFCHTNIPPYSGNITYCSNIKHKEIVLLYASCFSYSKSKRHQPPVENPSGVVVSFTSR